MLAVQPQHLLNAGSNAYVCGNGLADPGETCDGLDLGGLSCLDLGFMGGSLICSSQCTFDTTGCAACGNGKIDGAELCDGLDFGGLGCTDFGFTAGSLSCIGCASVDTSVCSTCGNGIVEPGEQCDDGGLAGGDGCTATCTFESGCTGAGSGCCDGTREGFADPVQFPDIAACGGAWQGHVSNASILCEPGWHVCSPPDAPADMAIVGAISFAQATGFAGCFAYNAAHDSNTCIPCTGLLHQDDMGGMGDACAFSDPTLASCTATGRVSADCCDGVLGCSYSPTLAGAVCCRGPGSTLPSPP